MNNSTLKLAFVVALEGSLIVSCEATPEPQRGASPSVGAVAAASPTPAPTPTPTPTPEEPASNRDRKPDVYMLDPETGAVTPFLTARRSQTNAEVSLDGERVVYQGRAPDGPPQIFVLEADGTRRRLTHMKGGASDPAWSPDGTQIAFAGTRRRAGDPRPDADIFVMNADGSRIRRFAGTPKDDGHPDWSPDGSRIVFHGRISHASDVWARLPLSEIWVASVGDRNPTRLRHGPYSYGQVDPAWSPDGRWIAYGSIDAMINNKLLSAELWLVRPNGSQRHRVERAGGYRVIENPSWSPDGRSIVFEQNDSFELGLHWDGAIGDIGIVDVRTGRYRQIVRDAVWDQPSWGPKGILVGLASKEANVQTVWSPTWNRPDATVVLKESGCELDSDASVVDPGVLAIEFVNESYHEGYMAVVQVPPGPFGDRRVRAGFFGDFMAGGWGERNKPSVTDIWSSPRAVTSGRWAVVCHKDLMHGPNILLVGGGVAGQIEVG